MVRPHLPLFKPQATTSIHLHKQCQAQKLVQAQKLIPVDPQTLTSFTSTETCSSRPPSIVFKPGQTTETCSSRPPSIVFKPGPDQAVRPSEPGTGVKPRFKHPY